MLGQVLGSHDRLTLEEYLETVDLQVVVQEGGTTTAET